MRNLVSKEAKLSILFDQGYKCFYCDLDFGTLIEYRSGRRSSKEMVLAPEWEHFIPYSYTQITDEGNMVASCKLCNQIKSNLMFFTIEEAREKIMEVRDGKRIKIKGRVWDYVTRKEALRGMRQYFPAI